MEKFLSADIDLVTDTIKVSGLTSAYTYSDAHEFYTSLSGVIFTETLTGKSITDGIFDAADLTISGVSAGSTLTALAIWKDTGTAATSPLIYYADTLSTGSAISLSLTGAQIIITWPEEVSKIFRI